MTGKRPDGGVAERSIAPDLQRIRRGVFRSIAELQAAFNAYLAEIRDGSVSNTTPRATASWSILISKKFFDRVNHDGLDGAGLVVTVLF
jgi:hypothetical protein